jgi:hypothetical protein
MGYRKILKEKVVHLRHSGFTLNAIVKQTSLPKTTVYDWIKAIPLSEVQRNSIKKRTLDALQAGRIRVQDENKLKLKKIEEDGRQEIGILTKRELLIAGTALYWAEGFKNKHEHRLGFCNSDPDMIRFYLRWLKDCLNVNKEDISFRVTINTSYKERIDEIEQYWSQVCVVSLEQFTKPFYQTTIWKKMYVDSNYYGVLRIHVKKSLKYLHYMRGLIQGLKEA